MSEHQEKRKKGRPTKPQFDNNGFDDSSIREEVSGLGISNADEIGDASEPLISSPVIERDYSKAKAHIIGDVPIEVPEPEEAIPVIDTTKQDGFDNNYGEVGNEPPYTDADRELLGGKRIDEVRAAAAASGQNNKSPQTGGDSSYGSGRTQERDKPLNPAVNDMTPKQKRESAEFMAKGTIQLYEMLNKGAKSWVQMDKDKINKKIMKGELDAESLHVEVPISPTETTSIIEVIDDINNNAEEVFSVSEEFKAEAEPLLSKIFAKKGIMMSDEAQLGWVFGVDIVQKIYAIVNLKSSISQIIRIGEDTIKEARKSAAQPQPTVIIQNTQAAPSSQANTNSQANGSGNEDSAPKATATVHSSDGERIEVKIEGDVKRKRGRPAKKQIVDVEPDER